MRSLVPRKLPVIWRHTLDGSDGAPTSTGMSAPDRNGDMSGQIEISVGPTPDIFPELWAALRLIRETVEELAPLGSVPNGEHLTAEPMREAEVIIRGIHAIARSASPST
jgi:hypothetical protein